MLEPIVRDGYPELALSVVRDLVREQELRERALARRASRRAARRAARRVRLARWLGRPEPDPSTEGHP